MFGIDLLYIFCTIILLIEIYNETFLMNYGSFIERVKHLFSLKMIFKTIKLTSFTFFVYLVLIKFQIVKPLDNNFINNYILSVKSDEIYKYYIPVIIYALIIILSNSIEVFRQFSFNHYNERRLNQFLAFIFFIFYRAIAFTYTFFIAKYVLEFLLKLNIFFTNNSLRIMDWYFINSVQNNNYNTGVYLSLILTTITFFIFNNAFLKVNSNYFNYRTIEWTFFGYFFITIILSIGVFFGFFSILNAFYNIKSSSFENWLSTEKTIGLLPLRLASILILFNLFSYIYKEILNRKLLHFFTLGLFPIRNIENYGLQININSRESLYFAQISFYILNIAVAEYYVILDYQIIYLSILNFAILFIQDDFKIINEYSKGLSNILPSHYRRIQVFNIIMLVSSSLALLTSRSYGELILYLSLTILLSLLYFYNYKLVNSQDYIF